MPDQEIVVAKIGGRWARFKNMQHVPAECGKTVAVLPMEILDRVDPDAVFAAYVEIGGTLTKAKFLGFDLSHRASAIVAAAEKLPDGESMRPEPQGPKRRYERHSKVVYEFQKSTAPAMAELEKLAPQARVVYEVSTEGATTWPVVKTEEEMMQIFRAPEIVAKLKTRQDGYRIVQYYRSPLIGINLLRTR